MDKTKTEQIGNIERERIDLRDIFQIIIGSLGGALVIAPSQEYHTISENMPWLKLLILFIATLIFIGLIAYRMGVRAIASQKILAFWLFPIRIGLIYFISLLSCLFALWVYHLISMATPLLIIKKMVILALPATTGGTLIDLIGTKHK